MTNPKPREVPVSWSRITLQSMMVPNSAKIRFRSFSVASSGNPEQKEDWTDFRLIDTSVFEIDSVYGLQCSGSVTFWYGSGSGDPYLWLTDLDSDPAPDPDFFVSDLQDGNYIFFFVFFAYYCFKLKYIIFQR